MNSRVSLSLPAKFRPAKFHITAAFLAASLLSISHLSLPGLAKLPVSANKKTTNVEKSTFGNSPEASLRNKIRQCTERGDNAGALKYLNSFIRRFPRNSWALTNRAFTLYDLGRNREALRDFTASIELPPDFMKPYFSRALAYSKLGEFHNELNDLTAAIKQEPKNGDYFEARGFAHYKLGHHQEAIIDCLTAEKLGHNCIDLYSTFATAYEETAQFEKALKCHDKIIAWQPDSTFAWAQRARVNYKAGKLNDAFSDWKRSVSLAGGTSRLDVLTLMPFFSPTAKSPREFKESVARAVNVSFELPFQYVSRQHIGLPAMVNQRPMLLELDTGCTQSLLFEGALNAKEKSGPRMKGRKATGEPWDIRFFVAKNLTVGKMSLEKFPFMTSDDGMESDRINGLIGGNLLAQSVVKIDYANKKIRVSQSLDANSTKGMVGIPLIVKGNRPYCAVKIDGKLDCIALLDTGCPCNLSANSLLAPILPPNLKYNDKSGGPWLGQLDMDTVRFKSVSVSGIEVANQVFDVFKAEQATDAASEIILGNNFLSSFKSVTFDYRRRRIFFEKCPQNSSRSAQDLIQEARYFYKRGEYSAALANLDKCQHLNFDFIEECLDLKSQIYLDQANYRLALHVLEILLEIDPTNVYYYEDKVYALQQLGRITWESAKL